MRVVLLQSCVSDDPKTNAEVFLEGYGKASALGADLVATAEMSNFITSDPQIFASTVVEEGADVYLQMAQKAVRQTKTPLLIGSLGLRSSQPNGQEICPAHKRDAPPFVNRSFLLSGSGEIIARYDKIHLFDARINKGNNYRESRRFRAGERAVIGRLEAERRIGMTICYDLRFPGLYHRLARAGAQIIAVPAAFTRPTGAAHWKVLLRARAIETGCFVIAPAQAGQHPSRSPSHAPRESWGHSLVISPWGEILAEGGGAPELLCVDLDLAQINEARARVPSLWHEACFLGPDLAGSLHRRNGDEP